jgi:hypothetical protein
VHGSERGDGSRDVLEAHRLRWSRNLRCSYVPRSRDRPARGLDSLAADLRDAGFDVDVQLCDERTSVAEREERRVEASQRRAELLDARAGRLTGQANASTQRWTASRSATDPRRPPLRAPPPPRARPLAGGDEPRRRGPLGRAGGRARRPHGPRRGGQAPPPGVHRAAHRAWEAEERIARHRGRADLLEEAVEQLA